MYSITDKAKDLRAELKKELNANSKKISVKSAYCGCSAKITVTIKDLTINLEAVEKIANKYSSIDRCERTGEILSGGNDFVSVSYDWEILNKAQDEFLELAESLLVNKEASKYIDTQEQVRLQGEDLYYKGQRYFAREKYQLAKHMTLLNRQFNVQFQDPSLNFEW